MANRPAPALGLREGDLERLTRIVRSSSVPAGLAQRSRIVLLAAEGVANEAICERVGVSRNTVLAWRRRYAERGLAGLADEPRSGRPRRIDHRRIVSTTLLPPPKKYGVTHRFDGASAIGVDEHARRHTRKGAKSTTMITLLRQSAALNRGAHHG